MFQQSFIRTRKTAIMNKYMHYVPWYIYTRSARVFKPKMLTYVLTLPAGCFSFPPHPYWFWGPPGLSSVGIGVFFLGNKVSRA
jgi:hypothetical protein